MYVKYAGSSAGGLGAEDVYSLRENLPLNDEIVAYMYQYYACDKFKDLSAVYIPGALAFLLSTCDRDEARVLVERLQLAHAELVFFAISDNPTTGAGTHWSTLVYHRSSNSLRHYDSGTPLNSRAALRMAAAAAGFVAAPRLPAVVEVPTVPQQADVCESGVYMLAISKQLSKWHAAGQDVLAKEEKLPKALSPEGETERRLMLLALVEKLLAAEVVEQAVAEAQARRRSAERLM